MADAWKLASRSERLTERVQLGSTANQRMAAHSAHKSSTTTAAIAPASAPVESVRCRAVRFARAGCAPGLAVAVAPGVVVLGGTVGFVLGVAAPGVAAPGVVVLGVVLAGVVAEFGVVALGVAEFGVVLDVVGIGMFVPGTVAPPCATRSEAGCGRRGVAPNAAGEAIASSSESVVSEAVARVRARAPQGVCRAPRPDASSQTRPGATSQTRPGVVGRTPRHAFALIVSPC